jgi:hypothetical protein
MLRAIVFRRCELIMDNLGYIFSTDYVRPRDTSNSTAVATCLDGQKFHRWRLRDASIASAVSYQQLRMLLQCLPYPFMAIS